MSNRITLATLDTLIRRLNVMTGMPQATYLRNHGGDERLVAQVGNYHLSAAYGGAALHQIVDAGGATRDVLRTGHTTKKDLYAQIHAYMSGLVDSEESRINGKPETASEVAS